MTDCMPIRPVRRHQGDREPTCRNCGQLVHCRKAPNGVLTYTHKETSEKAVG